MIANEMKKFRNNIKYKVEGLDILFADGGVESIKPGMVSHLYIEKDYDTLFFPIMNISVVMEDVLYDRINRENETVKFRLKINKIIYNADGQFLRYDTMCNDLFISFLDKKTVVTDTESIKDKKKIEQDDNPTNRANNRNFYLFKEDVIKCKDIINISVESASLTDLVLYMFNACKITKLLMSKLDNLTSVNNLLIPAGNLIECVNYIDNLKGFYNKGLTLFFDIDTAYFIDNSSKCTAWRKNEIRVTHMHVSNQQSQSSLLTGIYTDKARKSNHIFANTDRIIISNPNLLNDQLKGNNITVINSKNMNKTTVNEKVTQVGNPNKRLLVSAEDNKYMISAMKHRLKENECNLKIAFMGVDISVFDPNKEFLLTYEDSNLNGKYGGNYRISNVVAALKKDGEELVGDIECLFKKQ